MLPSVDVDSIVQYLTNCNGEKTMGGTEMRILIEIWIQQNKVLNGPNSNILCILDGYYITQAIIKVQLIRGIKVNAVYKSRESDHIPD